MPGVILETARQLLVLCSEIGDLATCQGAQTSHSASGLISGPEAAGRQVAAARLCWRAADSESEPDLPARFSPSRQQASMGHSAVGTH